MPREVDERKTKRALARLQRAKAEAEARGETLSEWESGFVESVETRLKTYGSAFADPQKGDLSEPLSGRQRVKMREIDRKARGRGRPAGVAADGTVDEAAGTGISPPRSRAPKQRKPMSRGKGFKPKGRAAGAGQRVRDIAEDLPPEERRPSGPPKLRLIDGGS